MHVAISSKQTPVWMRRHAVTVCDVCSSISGQKRAIRSQYDNTWIIGIDKWIVPEHDMDPAIWPHRYIRDLARVRRPCAERTLNPVVRSPRAQRRSWIGAVLLMPGPDRDGSQPNVAQYQDGA